MHLGSPRGPVGSKHIWGSASGGLFGSIRLIKKEAVRPRRINCLCWGVYIAYVEAVRRIHCLYWGLTFFLTFRLFLAFLLLIKSRKVVLHLLLTNKSSWDFVWPNDTCIIWFLWGLRLEIFFCLGWWHLLWLLKFNFKFYTIYIFYNYFIIPPQSLRLVRRRHFARHIFPYF